ncbi:hypothetical protein KC356_g338 [Hortaea werneckii]|nr:hypothetical protein KC356_g338 [Hortaea werneckii]
MRAGLRVPFPPPHSTASPFLQILRIRHSSLGSMYFCPLQGNPYVYVALDGGKEGSNWRWNRSLVVAQIGSLANPCVKEVFQAAHGSTC